MVYILTQLVRKMFNAFFVLYLTDTLYVQKVRNRLYSIGVEACDYFSYGFIDTDFALDVQLLESIPQIKISYGQKEEQTGTAL